MKNKSVFLILLALILSLSSPVLAHSNYGTTNGERSSEVKACKSARIYAKNDHTGNNRDHKFGNCNCEVQENGKWVCGVEYSDFEADS